MYQLLTHRGLESFLRFRVYNDILKIIKNKQIGVKKDINGYHHPIKTTLEHEEIRLTALKNLNKIKKVDVDICNTGITEDFTDKTIIERDLAKNGR